MIELSTEVEAVDDDKKIPMVELFSIDGKTYSIPDKEIPALSYQYLYHVRQNGLGWAESWLAEEMLGKEAYWALLNYPKFTHEIFEEIMAIARTVVFGEKRPKVPVNGSKSNTNSKRGSRTSRTETGS